MLKILGYPDRYSVAPGEEIAFKVSLEEGTHFESRVVRVVHGDANPAGPGLKFRHVPTGADGRPSVVLTITNSTGATATYAVLVAFTDSSGRTLQSTVAGARDVPAGGHATVVAAAAAPAQGTTGAKVLKALRI